MSWGTELWDQYDNIATHTQKGIDFLEKYGHFVDQRCKIEQEYASKLRRLVKTYVPKKKDEDEYQFTCTRAYKNLLNELGDQAGQHEMIAENLSTSVVQELTVLVKQLKDDRRKYLNEGSRIQNELQTSLNQLNKTKEKYEKAFGASERALDAYHKADADLNLSRAEVEKQRINSTIKSQQFEDSKNEYASQLQKTNEAQSKYYNHFSPQVLNNFQDLNEKRIKCIQNFMLKAVQSEKEVLPIISQCLDEIAKNAESINEKEDSRLAIEKFKSGFTPPNDIPFEDLRSETGSTKDGGDNTSVNGSMSSMVGGNQSSSSFPHLDKKTILGTITGGRARKRSGLLGLFSANKGSNGNFFEKEDFSDLPPNQRRKKLQSKIDEITGKICQETAARDGLMKMKQVYESNPALGDPLSIQGQLTDNGQRLDKLRSEQRKFQGYLDDMDGRSGSPTVSGQAQGASKRNSSVQVVTGPADSSSSSSKAAGRRRNSVSDGADSLSRSASDSSVSNNQVKSPSSNGATNQTKSEPIRKVTCRILSPVTKVGDEAKQSLSSSTSDYDRSSSSAAHSGGSTMSSSSAPVQLSSQAPVDVDDQEDEFYDTEPLPILGKCKALYPFEVTSEGSIRMEEGEDLWLIEIDQGDGWTRVRRVKASALDPMPEGFVPSSYIETTEMFDSPMHQEP